MDKQEQKTAQENISRIDEIQARISAYEEARKELAQETETTIKTLYKWTAPERVFTPKSRKFFILIASAFVIGIVVSAILESLMFILVLVSLLTLIYINHSVPPKEAEYEITNKGIKTYGKIFLWKNVENFWITERGNNLLLNINIKERTEDRIILLVGTGEPKKIVHGLIKYIPYMEKPGNNFLTNYIEGKYISIVEYLDLEGMPEERTNLEPKVHRI
ncbi:hypothetical protein JW796_01820 [Candidatus Dojkabacteria bacterium]|nr:hypothetical protein [Candidatus Dojkabacteria bacterium]